MTGTPLRGRYASRLNSFASGYEAEWGRKPSVTEMLARASLVRGLGHVDLNFPDHMADTRDIVAMARDLGLQVNGLAMRYYSDPGFRRGAFTNPDHGVRRAAIELTKRGMDAAAAAGVGLMTLWLGQDGWDTAFQVDYRQLWDWEVAGIAEVAGHSPAMDVAIEYKPDEPRAFALLRDAATTLLAIREAGAANLGVTLDFAHMLYAGEMPAAAAALVARHSRVLGVHLNDGYGKRDDGLMVGAVHPVQTVELLAGLRQVGYQGVIYFDTFPDFTGLDPVAECEANIATVEAMLAAIERLQADPVLAGAVAAQDSVAALRRVRQHLSG